MGKGANWLKYLNILEEKCEESLYPVLGGLYSYHNQGHVVFMEEYTYRTVE